MIDDFPERLPRDEINHILDECNLILLNIGSDLLNKVGEIHSLFDQLKLISKKVNKL
jgi:hypothetical protein